MSFPVKISEGCAMKGSFHTPFMPEINDKELRERERERIWRFFWVWLSLMNMWREWYSEQSEHYICHHRKEGEMLDGNAGTFLFLCKDLMVPLTVSPQR